MAIKLLSATDHGTTGIEFVIHLDDTKFEEDGETPDPACVFVASWGSYESSGNEGEGKPEYLQRIAREALLLAQDRVARQPVDLTREISGLIG